jgi:hypothetical protein
VKTSTCSITIAPAILTLGCVSGSGQVNFNYASALAATGGTPPYSFSITAGALPPGLTLNPTTGAVTGMPTTAGIFSFTAKVTDSTGSSALTKSSNCSITIGDGQLEGCSLGFWKTHGTLWDGGSSTLVGVTYRTTQGFNAVFGVTAAQSGKADSVTLMQAISTGGGGLNALGRQVVAAILNSQSVNYPLSASIVILRYRVAVGAVACPPIPADLTHCDTVDPLQNELNGYNNFEGGLCSGSLAQGPACSSATPGNAKVTLSWSKLSGAASYRVKRATSSGGAYTTIKTDVTSTSYTDTSVANGTAYYYVISAIKSGAETAESKELIAIPTAGLPSPWATKDVGSVATAGGASYASSTFSVLGSGADIGNAADAFRFVYQSGNGDCSVVAKVLTVQNTDPSAKAGVMIRETLNPESKNAFVALTPANGALFQYRNATAGNTASVATAGLAAPYWVKITRVGNVFTGYQSSNGTTWMQIGASQTISMGSSVYIGIGVTSHSNGALCKATLGNVTATP